MNKLRVLSSALKNDWRKIAFTVVLLICFGGLFFLLWKNDSIPLPILAQPTIPVPYIPPSPVVEKSLNQLFQETVANNVDLNSGITMERNPIGVGINQPTLTPNYIEYIVYNHTEENVVFPDQGFGLQVYWLDRANQRWEKLLLAHNPDATDKILPANLEIFDFNISNSWEPPPSDIELLLRDELRIYIQGIGVTTGKSYGAFMDVSLKY